MKGHILVIDDERSMVELLETDLALRGYKVSGFTSSAAALETLAATDAQVALTDFHMPGVNGLQVCERVVANRPDIPVVVMTAFGSMETAIEAIRAGAWDFVTKPVEMELLAVAVEEGRYREDFYFRINVIQLDLPPLRSRGNDVLLIARSLLQVFAHQMGKNVTDFQTSVAERFLNYDWPGNVRELRNVLERAVALTEFEKLIVDDLPERIRDYRQATFRIDTSNPAELQTLEAVEQQYIQRVLKSVQGNRTEAARILGVDRKTLYRRLKQDEES